MMLVKYYNGHAYQFCVANYYHTGEISIEAYEPYLGKVDGQQSQLCAHRQCPHARPRRGGVVAHARSRSGPVLTMSRLDCG